MPIISWCFLNSNSRLFSWQIFRRITLITIKGLINARCLTLGVPLAILFYLSLPLISIHKSRRAKLFVYSPSWSLECYPSTHYKIKVSIESDFVCPSIIPIPWANKSNLAFKSIDYYWPILKINTFRKWITILKNLFCSLETEIRFRCEYNAVLAVRKDSALKSRKHLLVGMNKTSSRYILKLNVRWLLRDLLWNMLLRLT